MREIYVFVDSDGVVRYVGCSSNAKRRVNQHWRYRDDKNTPCAAWLRSLQDPPRFVVVDEVDDDHAGYAEQAWIALFSVVADSKLLNVTTGGEAGFSRMYPRPPVSEETRKRLSEVSRGKVVSEETRQKMREATSARWRDGFYQRVLPSKRPKQSEAMRRQWASLSPEEKKARVAKMLAGRKNTKHSPETKQKMRDAAIAREERKRREREATDG
jgi:hypothetical protein